VVIAYEMLTHPGSCPWAQSPWKLPIACMGTATAGVVVVSSMGVGVSSTMCSLTWEADYVSGVCVFCVPLCVTPTTSSTDFVDRLKS